MKKSRPQKAAVFLFIFAFMALYSPRLLADTPNTGNLTGFIYQADRTSPFEKAFVRLQNVATGSIYKSTISDAFGAFWIDEIEKGLYIVSVRTEKGNFHSRNIIGVRENETARAAFALKFIGRERKENIPVGTAEVIASSEPVIYDYRVVASDEPEDPEPPEDEDPEPPEDEDQEPPEDEDPEPPEDEDPEPPEDEDPEPPEDEDPEPPEDEDPEPPEDEDPEPPEDEDPEPPDKPDPPGPPDLPPDVPPGPPVDPPEPNPSPHKPAK